MHNNIKKNKKNIYYSIIINVHTSVFFEIPKLLKFAPVCYKVEILRIFKVVSCLETLPISRLEGLRGKSY